MVARLTTEELKEEGIEIASIPWPNEKKEN